MKNVRESGLTTKNQVKSGKFLSHDSRFLSEVREQEEPYTCKTFTCRKLRLIRDGRLEKLWGGGGGIFELQEFFSL